MGTDFVKFRQLREVGVFLDEDILRLGWLCFRFQKLGPSEEIHNVAVGQF